VAGPWDCFFCSAWTFYGRAYRRASPEAAAAELHSIREPNVFIVDDVAFIKADHGDAIDREVEKRRIKKRYWRRGPMCCFGTPTCSLAGGGWGWSTCSSGSKRWMRPRSSFIESVSART
jgi:hypothetical protein